MMSTETRATVEDLYRVRDKAELVAGELRIMKPAGWLPGRSSSAISISLRQHERLTRSGVALPDNVT